MVLILAAYRFLEFPGIMGRHFSAELWAASQCDTHGLGLGLLSFNAGIRGYILLGHEVMNARTPKGVLVTGGPLNS